MTPDIVKLRDSLPTLESIIQRLELELVDDPSWNEPSDTSYLSAADRENPDIAANVEAMRETNRLIAWFGRDAEGYLGLWRGPNNRSLTEAPVVRLDSEGQYSIVAATVPEYLAIAMPEDEFASTRDALTAAGFAVGFNPDAIWGALDAFDDDPNAYRAELYERARVARGLPRTDEDEDEEEAEAEVRDDGASDVGANGDGRAYDEHDEEDEGEQLAAADDDEEEGGEEEERAASAEYDEEEGGEEEERAASAEYDEEEGGEELEAGGEEHDEEEDEEEQEAIPAPTQLAEGTMPAMVVVSAELEETEFDFGDEDEDEDEEETGDREPVVAQVPAHRARAATVPATKSATAKAAAKKPSKAPAKKAAGKTPAKKAAGKTPAKKAAGKAPAKKAAGKAPAKKAAGKAPTKKAPAKKVSKAPAKKAAGKATAKKAAKPAAKKASAKKAGKATAKKRR